MTSPDDGRPLAFSTRAIHSPNPGPVVEEPASIPVWLSADYFFPGLEHYADIVAGRRPGYAYARFGTPTHTAFHSALASLEGAEAALSFASGMAAVTTCVMTLVNGGDHIVAHRGIYNTTHTLLESFLPRFGVATTFVEPEARAVEDAIGPQTRVAIFDSIATPTFRVADVAGIAAVCADRGVHLIIDNTIATPYLLRPLEWSGVSLVLHSTSKYFGGHADLIGGAVAGPTDLIDRVLGTARQQGTIGGAFEAWLALRGLQTLALRVRHQCQTAMALAEVLAARPEVASVGYSGLPQHPDHERASKLLGGVHFGAVLSFTLRGGYPAADRFCDALRVAKVGSGFGSVITEVRHPATTSHRFMTEQQRQDAGIGDGLLRVSVGAEDPDDLIADFVRALEASGPSTAAPTGAP